MAGWYEIYVSIAKYHLNTSRAIALELRPSTEMLYEVLETLTPLEHYCGVQCSHQSCWGKRKSEKVEKTAVQIELDAGLRFDGTGISRAVLAVPVAPARASRTTQCSLSHIALQWPLWRIIVLVLRLCRRYVPAFFVRLSISSRGNAFASADLLLLRRLVFSVDLLFQQDLVALLLIANHPHTQFPATSRKTFTKRKMSNTGRVPGRRRSLKRQKKKNFPRGTSFQKVTHQGRRVELKLITEVSRDKKFESSMKYNTLVKHRVADLDGLFSGKWQDLASFVSYLINKQHTSFREDFLPDGSFKHIGVHGPQSTRDIEDSQKIMLLTHNKVGPYNLPNFAIAEHHKQLFRESKSYHYLSEFELANVEYRHMGWGPVLMQAWLACLANVDNLGKYAFTGLYLLSPAPIGAELEAEKYLRVVHLLIEQYKKSGYEVILAGDDRLDGPIYIMGQQFPKLAALPQSTMFGPGAFDSEAPESPLTPPPNGGFKTPPGLPNVFQNRQQSANNRPWDDQCSEDEDPVTRHRRRPAGPGPPLFSDDEDMIMQDSSEDEKDWAARHSNADRKSLATAGRIILQPVPRRPRTASAVAASEFIEKHINSNMTQAAQALNLSPVPKPKLSILKRGANPPRPGLDYPWHDRKIYAVTPSTDPEWITEGWAWHNNELAMQGLSSLAATSVPAPAPTKGTALTITQASALPRPTPMLPPATSVPGRPHRSRYDVPDASGEWPARRILKEGKKQYLIEWEVHAQTGEEFEPSWEPKWCANETLVAAWNASQNR
ncbi:hypothetical protein DOTSEDRAFT_39665 [Dothistroma septosporum NZE10]|uniref:Chromo domain-containing protein n=1 Tax=Dothistroma septosporum (strain NZE10 / CBS 128990) TaxID=675120 RepID=M2WHQ6_DOTSN|nr:hypothetical protein DOTSEDRAFT_39665 [Dothistroma septosporum NZE10]